MTIDRRMFLKISALVAAGVASDRLLLAGLAQVDPATLIPPGSPLTAGRWAMLIDVRKCLEKNKCQECVLACHKSHNVPDFGNKKDEIKWIWKEPFEHGFPNQAQPYLKEDLKHAPTLLLCNHCDRPPCVRVCPTQATFKRRDGIVAMDQHRCIGCRFCIAACPYGSRSFNWKDPRPHLAQIDSDYPTRTKGVVEKCNFCSERLAQGQMPVCVETCPAKALTFGDLSDEASNVRKLMEQNFVIRRRPELGTEPAVYYIV